MQILIVEDDLLTARGLSYLLEREGYGIVLASDLNTATAILDVQDFDLVLLDLTLPDGDSYDLAMQLKRQSSSSAIIFLTARDDESHVVRGLELGADDYITKPFSSRELMLRIRNVLARQRATSNIVSIGDLQYDYLNQRVAIAGQAITLTTLELKILDCLLEKPGQVVTRKYLLDVIYNSSGHFVNDNTLSVYLKRLRQKLARPGLIQTVKQLGYRIAPEDFRES